MVRPTVVELRSKLAQSKALLAKAIAAAGVQRETFTLSTAFGRRLRKSAA
ncbi:hypothetical protein [Sphingomonas sanxanigenens]|uniref:Uncharacterized protein n=1 Tax=Sphingomonas sanxanigenens DSM 19645 = NX02 TaxID=1123269 RepID=W0AEN6_9SPHN|nr:hypothetical protein [Sphingomonas sanxanigenens]AHE56379.1 hypothetical protein NX02_23845 [Sphingomonas sanxanigenens DSM 19645 = NX02]